LECNGVRRHRTEKFIERAGTGEALVMGGNEAVKEKSGKENPKTKRPRVVGFGRVVVGEAKEEKR